MIKLSLPISRLMRENLSILMTFAFSRGPLQSLIEKNFLGEWKYLEETVFSMAEQRAEKACLELAIFLRYLDDEEGLSKYWDSRTDFRFGRLVARDGPEEELKLCDVANKIIHAVGFGWVGSRRHRRRNFGCCVRKRGWMKSQSNSVLETDEGSGLFAARAVDNFGPMPFHTGTM